MISCCVHVAYIRPLVLRMLVKVLLKGPLRKQQAMEVSYFKKTKLLKLEIFIHIDSLNLNVISPSKG